MGTELLIVLALILVNGVFAGAEIAVIGVRKHYVQERAATGDQRAMAVQRLRDHPERFLATVQIGITAVSAAAAAFGGARIASDLAPSLVRAGLGDYADEAAFAIVIATITFLSLVIGELVPKSLALRYSERYAFLIAPTFERLARIASPIVWILTACSNVVLRVFGDRTSFMESRMSRDEVQQVVVEAAAAGAVDASASEIATRALELPEVSVAEVMVPRERIVALPRMATTDEIQRLLAEQGHSRVLIHDGDLDKVVGYVIARDVGARFWEHGQVSINSIVRPILTFAATTRLDKVLRAMQHRRVTIAIVVDERGGTAGLVTIEDLVEELVGEIEDELDTPEDTIRAESAETAVVAGWVPVRKVNRALHTALPITRDGVTVAGLCMSLALAIPPAGTRLTAQDGTVIEVLDSSARRVRKVRIHHHQPRAENDPSA